MKIEILENLKHLLFGNNYIYIKGNTFMPLISGFEVDGYNIGYIEIYLDLKIENKKKIFHKTFFKNNKYYLRLLELGVGINITILDLSLFEKINYKGIQFVFINDNKFIDYKNTNELINNKDIFRYDGDIIISNLEIYKTKYKEYIFYKKMIFLDDSIFYKDLLIKYFINFYLYRWYFKINCFTYYYKKGFLNLCDILIYKENSFLNSIYFEKSFYVKKNIYKLNYNVIFNNSIIRNTSFALISNDIILKYLSLFNKAEIIILDSYSELSHGFILIKELKKTVFISPIDIVGNIPYKGYVEIDVLKNRILFNKK